MVAAPRTANEARKQGRTPTRIDFENMPKSERRKWLRLNNRLIRVGPAAMPGMAIVCFYDKNMREFTDCVLVPEDEVLGA